MLQSVHVTKQYWFLRQSDLRCMIFEWGSPTLFRCAEYECADIARYFRKVKNCPTTYDTVKFCTEDHVVTPVWGVTHVL